MTFHRPKSSLLSNDADTDLDEIFDYTKAEHGFNQAVQYLDNLFERLVKNPIKRKQRFSPIFHLARPYPIFKGNVTYCIG